MDKASLLLLKSFSDMLGAKDNDMTEKEAETLIAAVDAWLQRQGIIVSLHVFGPAPSNGAYMIDGLGHKAASSMLPIERMNAQLCARMISEALRAFYNEADLAARIAVQVQC